jgi:hypothetical protein
MWGYGTGLTGYLAKHLADRRSRTDILRRMPRGLWLISRIGVTTREGYGPDRSMPSGLITREWAGMALGPLSYWQAIRLVNRADRADRSATTS